MPKRQSKAVTEPKEVVYCRFDRATIAAIDELCESNPLKPNRSRLIEAAVVEYIDRHGKSDRRAKANG